MIIRIFVTFISENSHTMAGKTGEAALQEKLEQIRLDYLSLVEKVKNENVKAAAVCSAAL